MKNISRRTAIKLIGFGACGCLLDNPVRPAASAPTAPLEVLYSLPLSGNFRVLHTTDIHAQLLPVFYREPNVNMGVGAARGQLPHLVEHAFLEKAGIAPDSPEAYAFTSINFERNARKYGRMGGLAHIATLLRQLREAAGGAGHTLTLDGGDLWQGSATALWTRGRDMVEVANMLAVDMMTGHWEFTYHEEELLANLRHFNGEFLSQNVRVKEDSLFDDAYFAMVARHGGLGLYDEDSARAFKPYALRELAGKRVAVIGQAFPRTANANPQGFIPDWTFGIREQDMQVLVETIRVNEAPDAVILLSHNGMDVDLKLASRIDGIDAIFGGHTHDGVPVPIEVATPSGKPCMVTSAGTNGKFVGVMDFAVDQSGVAGMRYHLLPVFADAIAADEAVHRKIISIRATVYDHAVVECRTKKYRVNAHRVGKRYTEILHEKLAIADRTLYRRGNFMGTWDQLICDAMHNEYTAQIVLSPGFRWGTTVLEGDWITMEDVMTQTAMTYGETYVQDMSGRALFEIMESVADNLFDPDPYLQSGGDMVRVSGMNYVIDPSKPLLKRISDARLASGQKIVMDQTYRVAGWAVVGPAPQGRLIWDIVRDYLLAARGADGVIAIRHVFHPHLVGVANDPGVSSYAGKLL